MHVTYLDMYNVSTLTCMYVCVFDLQALHVTDIVGTPSTVGCTIAYSIQPRSMYISTLIAHYFITA